MPTNKQPDAPSAPVEDALVAKLDDAFPQSWQPTKAGETVSGTLLRVEEGQTEFGPAPIVIMMVGDEEISVWLFAESIRRSFLRQKPVAGERIAIRYEGEQEVKSPTPGRKKTAKVYRLVVDRPSVQTGPINWDALLGGQPPTSTNSNEDKEDEIPF